MCGIAGYFDLAGSKGHAGLRALGEAMNSSIAHRGPDDAGVWVDGRGRCMLAQRRLAIVDLSEAGHQPMVGPEGRSAITYNGEVYNFPDLRRDLEARGAAFRSHTDTEVVLHLARNDPVGCLPSLRGMFAFGYYDAEQDSLFLARDPLGKKPLYYAHRADRFAFASELTALADLEDLDRSIDADGLGDYLLLQYVHAPGTIYRGVRKLPPGCWLRIDGRGSVTTGRYFSWTAGHAEGPPLPDTYEDRLRLLDDLLNKAVARRLLSDVPLGAFLSGGVDSALVTATMRRLGITPKTYSVGFADSPDSEHVAAREIAEHLGCDHHEIIIKPDAIELAPLIARSLDEPNGDSSCLPTYLLSEFTRRHVTVALSGDGGDEMFGGYGRYFDTIRESMSPPMNWSASSVYLGPRWTIFQPGQITELLGRMPERTGELLRQWKAQLEDARTPVMHRMRTLDANTYMPGAVLAKVDRMSMQFALEVRCPLLDVDLANFAAGIGESDCLVPGTSTISGKRMLKDLLARDVPRAWVDRRKVGFGLPAAFWNGPALREFAYDLLAAPSTRLTSHLNEAPLRRWLDSQQDPRHFSIYRLWPMLILELWLRHQAEESRSPRVTISRRATISGPHEMMGG